MISSGASTPPDVPDPSAMAQTSALTTSRPSSAAPSHVAARADRGWCRSRRPARAGRCRPPMPTTRPPRAGHHIQWIGSLREEVLAGVDESGQQPRDQTGQQSDDDGEAKRLGPQDGMARGPGRSARRRAAAPAPSPRRPTATATGMKLRGFHSNSSSSTASSTAATGVAKMAAMPPAAPATSSVLRSADGEMEELREQRAEGAAGHDDRAFGAERAAGADGDAPRRPA